MRNSKLSSSTSDNLLVDNDGDTSHTSRSSNVRASISGLRLNSKPNIYSKPGSASKSLGSRLLKRLSSSSGTSTQNLNSSFMSNANMSSEHSDENEDVQKEEESFKITTLEEYTTLNDLVSINRISNMHAEELFGFYSLAVMGEYLSELLSHDSTMKVKEAVQNYIGNLSSDENNTDSLSLSHQNFKTPIHLANHQEKERRKQELLKVRFLNGKNTLQKKAFPIKLKMMVFKKLDQFHFAAYIQQLQQSEEDVKKLASIQFGEAITEISVIPIISIDDKGIIQIFNSASTATFHFSKKEVIGKNVKMLCPTKIRKNHDDFLKRYLTTGEKRVVDCIRSVKGQTKEGKSIPIELRVSEIIDPINKKSSFVAFVRDTKSMVTQDEQITKITEKIFPKNIVHRLTSGEKVIDELQNCTMMYCDIVGFTELANGKSPSIVVNMLHDIFSCFDDIIYSKQYNSLMEKIKTIGDCYFVASGLSNNNSNNGSNGNKNSLNNSKSTSSGMTTALSNLNNENNLNGTM